MSNMKERQKAVLCGKDGFLPCGWGTILKDTSKTNIKK
jgi:hypothetical protein